MVRLAVCPRCSGKLYFETDPWGSYYQCLYCGGLWDVTVGHRQLERAVDRDYGRFVESEERRKARRGTTKFDKKTIEAAIRALRDAKADMAGSDLVDDVDD